MDVRPQSTYQIHPYSGHELPEIYINFVLNKWMTTYKAMNDYIKLIDADSYYRAYRPYVFGIMINEKNTIRVAVLSDDYDTALGFSVMRGNLLHYVYVHQDYQRNGIGRKLVPVEVKTFTHLTKRGMKLWTSKAPKAIFNPFHH